jgi:hypothetical protein
MEQPGSVHVQLDLVTYFAERGQRAPPPKPGRREARGRPCARGGRVEAAAGGTKRQATAARRARRRAAARARALAAGRRRAARRCGTSSGAAAGRPSRARRTPTAEAMLGRRSRRGKPPPAAKEVSPDEVPELSVKDLGPVRGAVPDTGPRPVQASGADALPPPTPTPAAARARRGIAFIGPLPPAAADPDAAPAGGHVQVHRLLRPEGVADRGHPAGRSGLQRPGGRHPLRQVRNPEGGIRVDRHRLRRLSDAETKRLGITQ